MDKYTALDNVTKWIKESSNEDFMKNFNKIDGEYLGVTIGDQCDFSDKHWFALRVVNSDHSDHRPLQPFGLYTTRNRELTMDDLGIIKSMGYDVVFSVFMNTGSEPKIDHRFNYFYILG